MIKICYCGKQFKTYNCLLKIGKGIYCSQSCANKGKNNPRWKKGWSIDINGYKRIYTGKNPKWSNRKREHRVFIEQIIGRELDSKEIIHHIDHNKLNNDINNLQIMTRQNHSRYHALRRWNRL